MGQLWISLTISAAVLQSARTAVQKRLTAALGVQGATLARYVYGVPVATLYALILKAATGSAWPGVTGLALAWGALAGCAQIAATMLLLRALQQKNFPVGVAYSKTDVVQAALFESTVLGVALSHQSAAAVGLSTLAVMLMSLAGTASPLRSFLLGWTEPAALMGLASGSLFAVSGVAVRGASLAMQSDDPLLSAALTLLLVISFQTVLLSGQIWMRDRSALLRVFRNWRVAAIAGAAGGLGSVCWFTALRLQAVSYVRTLGLIEIVFTFLWSRFLFRERASRPELVGVLLLLVGLVLLLAAP